MTDVPLGLRIRVLRHQSVSYESIGAQFGIGGARAREIRRDYDHREKWGQPCYTRHAPAGSVRCRRRPEPSDPAVFARSATGLLDGTINADHHEGEHQ